MGLSGLVEAGEAQGHGVPSRLRVPCSLDAFGPRMPRPLPCPSHGGCSATGPPTEYPGAQQLPRWEASDRSRAGWVFAPLPCPEVTAPPSLGRASVPEARKGGTWPQPPGLHPRDPDLQGGPGCGVAQPSLKHPWSCDFWTKSPPQPLPSGQPCPAAPGLAKPSARAFEEGALPVGAGAVGPSLPGTAWSRQLSGMSPVGQSRLSSWLVRERRLSGDPTLCPAHPLPQL